MAIDPWLRAPLPNIIDELQPVAAMLLGAKEDIVESLATLTHDAIWDKSLGAATVGFHVIHLAYSTERLLSYARGEELTEEQWADLKDERSANETHPTANYLLDKLERSVSAAITQLEKTSRDTLALPRTIGRKKIPSNTRQIIEHAGEHAARHAGQVVTTVKVLHHLLKGRSL